MKSRTQDLRSAISSEVGVMGGTLPSPTLSDDVLFPHWEQLSNAIQLSERITALSLKNVQPDARTLKIIEASVRQKGITEFVLARNSFHGGEGVQFAINVLKSNRTTKRLGWGRNQFLSTKDACDLVDATLEYPTISTVGFIRTFSEGIIPYTPVKHLFDISRRDLYEPQQ